jgi:V/A-type H+-transporting ATPase subunit B
VEPTEKRFTEMLPPETRLHINETSELLAARSSLLIMKSIPGTKYGEMVEVIDAVGRTKYGQVIEVSKDATVMQVFGGLSGTDLKQSKVRLKGETSKMAVSIDMLGNVYNGLGRPLNKEGTIIPEDYVDINGSPINPYSRLPPSEFVETGISAIDGLLTVVRGVKLPIFTGSGLPHNEIAAQIVRQASLRGSTEKFAVVFAAIGVGYDDARFFIRDFEETGAIDRTITFINTASDPVAERIATPRVALTAAEHLAWKHDMHVITILLDMLNYCEALRELSASRDEVPGRRGYPGYMYTDLSMIYERVGRIRGKEGSLTVFPIVSMPDDDITHPIPDLTGYITEGQIVLSRELHTRGIYPPVDAFLSLSRMMKDGIGPEKTREDHYDVFMQLFAAYSRGQYLRELSIIVGSEALGAEDRKFLGFADEFERKFISQGTREKRPIEETLDLAWNLLAMLPESELKLIRQHFIEKYHANWRAKRVDSGNQA